MRNYRSLFFLLTMLAGIFAEIFISGCSVARQTRHVSNLANCTFALRSVNDINLAGVEFQDVHSMTDLSLTEGLQIMSALTQPTLPLSMQLMIEGKNPNDNEAGIRGMEWILFIDDIELTNGTLTQPVAIPPKGSTVIPVDIAFDLKKALTGKSGEALINFCLNLAGSGNQPTRFKIKMKPVILVGISTLKYPGYITVTTDYSNK